MAMKKSSITNTEIETETATMITVVFEPFFSENHKAAQIVSTIWVIQEKGHVSMYVFSPVNGSCGTSNIEAL